MLIVIARDTTSYPNMILETLSEDGVTVRRYELSAAEGYVLHDHTTGCYPGDEEIGEPPVCYYCRKVYIPRTFDPADVIADYEAVLESTVPAENIFAAPNPDHEIM